jgi:DNA-binding response OmpR family regulator
MVYFDKEMMNRIISNLISNAFKFTDSGGRIDVTLKRIIDHSIREKDKEGYVVITLTDTGIGIPPDRLDKIFDRFYQVDGSHTREREGTGIGLSLTKELVELHKGEISVESEAGRGTTFTLQFPLGKDHLEPAEISEAADADAEYEVFTDEAEITGTEYQNGSTEDELVAGTEKPIVLLVEDNADVRSYVKDYLREKYILMEADNGLDGLTIAVEKIPDLILSDIMMPKMNGVELCNKLKSDERTSHIPVILLTAKASGEDKIEGLETGADDYIMKPFDARELQVRIKNLIDQRRKLREYFKKQSLFEIEEDSITPADKKFLQKAIDVIHDHISDPEFSVDLFAGEMALSRSQLHRKLTALYSESPRDFIRRIRLSRAAKLIEQHFGNISEIALEVGFSNPAHFTRCFKQQFNKTPSEYEKSI